ncbi:MarC family protein [Sulfuriferula thiophila]|uniref:MarC family protein n=1 Tax=Sulfuriferula thiophila TaxID=1781211 RepID=UPI00167A462E|nr:MarC family protein [Sulfuriferula thiophila]
MISQLHLTEQIKFLVGLFAIVNPLGAIPIFLSMAADRRSAEMHRTAAKTSVAVVIILILSVWAGDSLLGFFGIGIPAFRIAGGMLVLMIAIAMFHAKVSQARHTDAEELEAESKVDISVVPLAIPLLAGPGAISLVIVGAHQASSLLDKLFFSLSIALMGLIIWVVLLLAEPIGNRLGTAGLNIATRVMGLILAAMAVQFMVDGLVVLLPGLAH